MLKILITALLLLIFLQDFKSRGVYWFLFPALLLLSVASSWKFMTMDIWWNLLFLAFMLLMLTAYVSLKEGRIVNITKGFFSLGDILFLLAIIPLFSFQSYILFFTAGTTGTLMIHLVVSKIQSGNQETIPYAGYMSLVLIPCLFIEGQFSGYINIYG